jgi:nitrite reductase (NADH) small subunit/3-phenylpropionate/trans-cinnamate dioxygenase ferredoxin subunit
MPIKHRVAPLADFVEDEGIRCEVEGHPIVVIRHANRLHAVGDTCPHMGASLAEGYVDGNAVICPWHGWLFDLNTGTSPFDDNARIPVYRVFVEDGDVFVEVNAEAPEAGECPAGPRRDVG